MTYRLTVFVFAIVVLPTATLIAQTSGTTSGRYSTYTVSQDMQEMDDGSSVVLTHYHQKTFAEDTGHPMDDMSSMCVGTLKVNSEGGVDSGYGSCFSANVGGDGVGMWWRMTHGGTDDCPDICGDWGYYAADGGLTGLEGSGTWERTSLFPDGSSGTWEGSYSMP